jgi:ATP-binding cassette subfamily C protein LapB
VRTEAETIGRDANGVVLLVRRRTDSPAPDGPRQQQPNGPWPIIRRAQAALAAQKRMVWSLVAASVIVNVLGLLLPLFSMTVFDRVIPHGAMETLWALAIGLAAALVLEIAIRQARLKLGDAVMQNVSLSMQGELVARQLTAGPGDQPRGSGGLLQPAQDIDAIAGVAPSLLVGLAVDLPFFVLMMILIGSIGGSVVIAPLVGAVALGAIHLGAHAMARRAGFEHGGLVRRQQQLLIDALATRERIRLTGAAPRLLAHFERAADDAGYAGHRLRYWNGIAAQASAVVVQLVVAATIVIGAMQISSAAMTLGALTACMLLVSRSMLPLSGLIGLGFRVMQLIDAAGHASRLISAEPEAGGDARGRAAARIDGAISFANVSFAYPGEDRPSLSRITFSIRPGERIGLIGKSGCGKSSLLRLIVRLHEPQEGRIGLDDHDIRQLDPTALRRAVALMPQESALIDGTLRENLLLGLPPVDDAMFERVVRMSGAQEIAARRPEGYGLQVGPGGHRLSAGERQCVSLARALMGAPRLLLLDEPTSAFDNSHEQRLVQELRSLDPGTGMVIATHRMALLGLVDRVIWLDGGRIIADGPKDEVFRRHGIAA